MPTSLIDRSTIQFCREYFAFLPSCDIIWRTWFHLWGYLRSWYESKDMLEVNFLRFSKWCNCKRGAQRLVENPLKRSVFRQTTLSAHTVQMFIFSCDSIYHPLNFCEKKSIWVNVNRLHVGGGHLKKRPEWKSNVNNKKNIHFYYAHSFR